MGHPIFASLLHLIPIVQKKQFSRSSIFFQHLCILGYHGTIEIGFIIIIILIIITKISLLRRRSYIWSETKNHSEKDSFTFTSSSTSLRYFCHHHPHRRRRQHKIYVAEVDMVSGSLAHGVNGIWVGMAHRSVSHILITRATLCLSAIFVVVRCLSARPSVRVSQAGIVSERMKLSLKLLDPLAGPPF